ncbi:MAG: HAMP domain-containing protein [Burkholderiaceae bacterium]|nr:methyl-accepting chemotaxis protein [Aquabacterium sp.]NUP84826.1 HAMP domain-containing protein [Burkholderiaceae bacterium]
MSTSYSIRSRLNWLFLVIVAGLLAAMAAFNYQAGRREREAALHEELGSIVARMSGSLPAALWNFDQGQIDRIVAAEMGAKFIESIVVVQDKKIAGGMARDSAGQVATIKQAPPSGEFSGGAPLSFVDGGKKQELGTVTVNISYETVRAAMRGELIRQTIQALVLAVALMAALSLSLARVVVHPLERVRDALEQIGAGSADLTRRLPLTGSVEFIGIAHGFNAFVERLDRVIQQVRQQAETVSVGSKEIADGNLDLSHRTEETASHVQAIAQTVTEMRHSVEVNAEGAETANRCGRDAAQIADRGGELMDTVIKTMDEMSTSAGRITEITSVIDTIAFQTNILALNAAVEAARAGEQGRGFAVVAGEVRSLAQRSGEAAREIKELIDDTVARVGNGQQQVDAAGRTIREVVGAIRKVSDILGEITTASQQQRQSIGQVGDAIASIDEATQRNAALVEQVSAAATSVRESTSGLVAAVGAFTVSERS